jgi:hypothetical protein
MRKKPDGGDWLKDILTGIKTRDSLTSDQKDWIRKVDNEAFDTKLSTFSDRILSKFNNKFDFIRFVWKLVDNPFKQHLNLKYSESTGLFSHNLDADKLFNGINAFLIKNEQVLDSYNGNLYNYVNSLFKDGTSLYPLHESDKGFLTSFADKMVGSLNSVLTSTQRQELALALAKMGYVTIEPSSGGSTGSTGGDGGGGGGSTVPSEPEVEVPSSPEQPVSVNVPSDAVKVTVSDGKAVVTIDDKTVDNLIKLLGDAEKKADGRPLAVVLDLVSDKIGVNAEINLPARLIAEAAGKGAALTVNLKNVGIDVPASAIDTGNEIKLKVQAVQGDDAVKGVGTVAGMKVIGNAVDIELTSGGRNALSSGEKAVLRFNIKGLAVNTDKLGAYFVDRENNKLVFVGGRVDRAANELRAIVPHFSTYVLMEYDRTFDDIKTHWARKYIESMAAKHVVDGRTPTSFAPNDNLTRAEFTKLMVTAMELDLKPYKGTFEDVSKDAWYADYIQTAYENNLIQGRVEGKIFDPNGKITRQELMTIIGRALGEKADITAIAGYRDAGEIAEYARDYVALLIQKGLVNGYPDTTIKPGAGITRAEAVKIIYGFYNY